MLNQQKLVELEKIRKANGGLLTRPGVEKAARDTRHPFHDQFEWDDTIGGYQYRLIQAGELIRSVTMTLIEEEKVINSVFYIHHPALDPGEPGSVPVSQVKRNRRHSLDALAVELAAVEGSLRRAREIALALGLSSHFERMFKELTAIKSKVKAA